MRNLLSYIPRLCGVGLNEASIRLVLSEIGRENRRSGRDATVSGFSIAEINHALIVVSVKHSVVILVVGIHVGSGGRRRGSNIPIIHVSSTECHHRFCGLGESGVEHFQKSTLSSDHEIEIQDILVSKYSTLCNNLFAALMVLAPCEELLPRRGRTNSISEYAGSSSIVPTENNRSLGTGNRGICGGCTGGAGDEVMVHTTKNASGPLTL